MTRKPFACMLAMLFCVATASGFAACGNRGEDSSGSGSANNFEEGVYTNAVEAKTVKQNPADSREDAYEAFSTDGESLGTYKTIAAAINEAVANDAAEEKYGGYVEKLGGGHKLFINREGYAEGNDDVFWYYDEGTKLAAMDCFDSTGSISMLHNSNMITTNVTGYGSYSTQSWNGYKMLDVNGEEVTGRVAQTWELSSTMDSAVMYFTGRSSFPGITRLSYTIDMSEVKIVPNYAGTDATYAFMGFYAWQDYYVIAMGLACDVSTGNWYLYEGTSRDDSFSDVEYNLGECLMTSTWNDAEGYFEPDQNTVTLSIETLQLQDPDDAESTYQVDCLEIQCGDAGYKRYITDEYISRRFAGAALAYNNAYAFTAGLDIKNEVVKGVKSASVDYFNGAKFENLTVTSATAYVPKEEEMSDITYGSIINSEWRGKEHNLVMASSEHTAELYDYTILNTAAFATYTAKDGKDCFSFDYSKSGVSDEVLSGEAKTYQDEIDSLKVVTPENAAQYKEKIKELKAKYSPDNAEIPQRYFNVLDLSPIEAANEALIQSATNSEGGKLALQVNAMGKLQLYKYSGWETKESSDELTGYLWTDLQTMQKLLARAAELETTDKEDYASVLELTDADLAYWTETYNFVKGALADESLAQKITVVSEAPGKHGTATAKEEKTYLELVQDMFKYSFMIAAGTEWKTENDDPNSGHVTLMNFDNNGYPSSYLCTIVDILKAQGVELPKVLTDEVFNTIAYDDFYNGAYAPISGIVKIVNKIYASENGTKLTLKDLTEEELEFLNTVWTADYELSTHISWNWESGNKFESYYIGRIDRVIAYAGGTLPPAEEGDYHKFAQYADYLNEWLAAQGYEANTNGWGVNANEIVAE